MKYFSLTLIFSTLLLLQTMAQTDTLHLPEPIATDRPDQTEAAAIVPAGYVQMEFGFGHVEHKPGRTLILPNALLKYGVNEFFELRFITSYASTRIDGQPDADGFLPLTLGFKTKFTEEHGIWPKISLLGHFVLPGIVGNDVAIKNLAPDFRFAFAHTLSKSFSLGYNLGVFWDGSNPEPVFIYSLAPGYSVGKFGFYVEGYGFIPQGSDREVRFLMDGGMTYLVNNNLQLDLSYGHNVTDNFMESYTALGVSYRFRVKRQ